MKISFDNQVHPTYNRLEARARHILSEAGKTLSMPAKVIIEVIIVRRPTIAKLNEQYRHISKPTDVLSFPQSPIDQTHEYILGSIIISPAVVKEKGENMDDVLKHGLLHLLGYDHETNESEWEKVAEMIGCRF